MGNSHSVITDIFASNTLCITLSVIIFVLFVAQIVLYLWLYGPIAIYRLMDKPVIREKEPGVSVIVPLFIEDSHYLDHKLPILLTQDYEKFEVVVVYVGNNEYFFKDLQSLQRLYSNLTPIQIAATPRYPVSVKMALNVGIKGAKYDFVITTSYDSTPVSERWISLLAKGFQYGDVVFGYSGMAEQKGFANMVIREYQLNKSLAWISAAIRGRAYAASRNALGFKKSLYFDVRGFNHLDMSIGVDDLFVQKIVSPDNVSVVLSPRATCTERIWGGFKWWLQQARMLRTTHRFYPKGTLRPFTAELSLRTLFFGAVIAGIILLPWQFKLAALAVAAVRYLLALFVFTRNARRLGETGLAKMHILYDLIEPALRLFVAITPRTTGSKTWH